MEFVTAPLTLLMIHTIGYSVFPNLRLDILSGNKLKQFDTVVTGDKGIYIIGFLGDKPPTLHFLFVKIKSH